MSQRALRISVGRLAVVTVISLVSLPAQAYSSVEEATTAIVMVAEQTASEIGEVVDEFAVTVGTLGSEAAIVEAADMARAEIDAIWLAGKDQINNIKLEYPKRAKRCCRGRKVSNFSGSSGRPL